jgi:hypothetical protein
MSILDKRNQLQILNETKSFIQCICPVCGGSNLKISLASASLGAYKCWSNYCEPSEIREELGFENTENYYLSPYKVEISKSVYSSGIDRKIHSAKPISVADEHKVIECPDYESIASTTRTFADGSKKKTTVYPYSETQRVYRLDSYDPPSPKQIYLQWWNQATQSWELGVGNQSWRVYTRGFDTTNGGDTVVWVEGEKAAEHLKGLGVFAITNASHTYNYNYLYKIYMGFFLKFSKIKNVIVIPDEDEPGYHKADMILRTCWYLKKGAKLVTLKNIDPSFSFEPNSGVDIVDVDLENKNELAECL